MSLDYNYLQRYRSRDPLATIGLNGLQLHKVQGFIGEVYRHRVGSPRVVV